MNGSENYLFAEEFEEDDVDDAVVATVAIVGALSDPGDWNGLSTKYFLLREAQGCFECHIGIILQQCFVKHLGQLSHCSK